MELLNLLKSATKEELESFIIEIAKDSEHVKRLAEIRFSKDTDNDEKKIKTEIDEIIRENSDRYGFIDYRSSYKFERQMNQFFDSFMPRLIAEKNVDAAFKIICHLFFKIGDLDIDDSNGTITDLMYVVMDFFKDIIEIMNDKEKEVAHIWLEKNIENEKIIDYIREYIFDAYSDFFTDEESLKRQLNFFDSYLSKNFSSEKITDWNFRYKFEKYAICELKCMEELKFSNDEILKFCRKYDSIQKIADKLAEHFISTKEYSEAEKIYQKVIEENKDYLGIVSEEKKKLLELYKITNDVEKQKKIVSDFIMDGWQLNLDYYREYKSYFSSDEWKIEVENLLKKAKLKSQVEEIYFEEKRFEDLCQYIIKAHEKTKDISALETYIDCFKTIHTKEFISMYAECLEKQMYIASNRGMYKEVAEKLQTLSKVQGGKEKTLELKSNWLTTYKNRRAMKEELERIKV